MAVRGAGMLGDRTVLPWLVRQMRVPELAAAAGASFLELFPEADGNGELFASDRSARARRSPHSRMRTLAMLPVADRVGAWAERFR